MRKNMSFGIVLFVAFIISSYCIADDQIYIPDQLQPWRNWVLQKYKDISCPQQPEDSSAKRCAWPSGLSILANENGAKFSLTVNMYADDWVAIPGDSVFWPCEVNADGKQIAVLSKNELPQVQLSPGLHKISGTFKWDARPNSIRITAGTALVDVIVNDKKILHPVIDNNNMLWLREQNEAIKEDSAALDNADVKIYRKIIDDIPVYMVTIVKLIVSGNDREMHFGRVLPPDAVPIYIHSEIPARIEADGNIRAQVRNGTWIIEIKSRFADTKPVLTMEKKTREWPSQEIWAFQANPHLRTITVRGVSAIDPGQTGIPEEWKQLPVYLVTPDNKFEIVEDQRGDALPDPNRLTLDRQMWLDFNGKGFTIKDLIQGNVSRPGRMAMKSGYVLGSVTFDGVPQIITTVSDSVAGIEHRQGNMNLECLSWGKKKIVNTVGWNQSFSKVTAELNLPPGWSLFHISGVDYVHNSWVSKWTVWDLFLLLILMVSIYKLYNLKWGLIAGAVFLFTFHEKGIPPYLWLNLVAAIALFRVVPKTKIKKVLSIYVGLSLIIIVLLGIGFAVNQTRVALFPQLEKSESQFHDIMYPDNTSDGSESVSQKSFISSRYINEQQPLTQNFEMYDADAKVQTGPGIPLWRWNRVTFGWTGPVESEQKIMIFLINPIMNSLLTLLRVFLVFVLLYGLGKMIFKPENLVKYFSIKSKKATTLLILLSAVLFIPQKLKADIPSQDLLNELEKRLIHQNDCGTKCYSVQQGSISIDKDIVTVELDIDALKNVAVQLPGNRASWFATSVQINDKDAPALCSTHNDGLAAVIPPGHNKVVLKGPVTGSRGEIQFPLSVNNFSYVSDQWTISGIVHGKVPGGIVRFDKKDDSKDALPSQNGELSSDQALPFVEVSRTIVLDKEWSVTTTVKRISPESDPLSIRIPLIPNESVISSPTADPIGFITVYMTRDQQEFTWHSTLKISSEIVLDVENQDKWVEVWTLDPSPRWHVEISGLAQSKQDAGTAGSLQVWHPLPGEKVVLKVQRPKAVAGPTATIKSALLNFTPGRKTGDNSLVLSVLSSQADRLTVNIPQNTTIENIKINDISQIVTMNKGLLSIPVHPGTQNVEINWKSKDAFGFLTKTPRVDCGMRSSNVEINCTVPVDRWIVLAGGPMMGPALLFWAILVVLLLISIGLSKIHALPLKWYQWFLLFAGMSTVDNVGGIFIVIWFVVLKYRLKITKENRYFNYWQIGTILLTIAAIGSLFATIPLGLLSIPDMQVAGNGSSAHFLKWYQDVTGALFPQGWFISLPIWVYRMLMLLWSLWLAFFMSKWLKWGWDSFSSGGFWKTAAKKETKAA